MANEIELMVCVQDPKFAKSVLDSNLTLGARLPDGIRSDINHKIEFADQNWKKPNKQKYIQSIAKIKPRIATVLDLERPEQFDEVMDWAETIAQHVLETIVIIPKYNDAIPNIPKSIAGKEVRLGYSVKTSYGQTDVPIEEFNKSSFGIHLLGGSPHKQIYHAQIMNVVSIDCNSMIYSGLKGKILSPLLHGTKWVDHKNYFNIEKAMNNAPYICFDESCKNMIKLWINHGFKLSGKLSEQL